MKQLLRTSCRVYCVDKNLDINTFKIEEFKKLMQAAAVLPIKIIIDWLLDETNSIYFIKDTESFTTISKNGFMLENFELKSLDEAYKWYRRRLRDARHRRLSYKSKNI